MGFYYLSRSSLITALIITIWLCANIFINVPPNFNIYKGDVIYKECTKIDTIVYRDGRIKHLEYHYDFTYLTKGGHSVNVTDYVYYTDDYNFEKFEKENQFYVTSNWSITIFVLLCIFGYFGSLTIIIEDGLDDINQMLYGNQQTMIKARDMRFKHYKILTDLFGYSDEESRQLRYKAIDMAQNSPEYKRDIECGYKICVPNMTDIDELVESNVKKLIKEKQQKETNITNG